MKKKMTVREWLAKKKYIGHVSITYECQPIDGEEEMTIRTETVECVLCYIDGQYSVINLTDQYLEWHPNSSYQLGNTKVIVVETFDEYVNSFKFNLLDSDDLIKTKLIDFNYVIEELD